MYKLIKFLAPLVLVTFFFTSVVGTGWGEVKVRADIRMDNTVAPNEKFKVEARFYRELATGMEESSEQPILENVIKLNLPEGFAASDLNPKPESDGALIYRLRAPKTPGKYSLMFRCSSPEATFTKEIKVRANMFFTFLLGWGLPIAATALYFQNNKPAALLSSPDAPSEDLRYWLGAFVVFCATAYIGEWIGAQIDDSLLENK